jgi:hypothetical protein
MKRTAEMHVVHYADNVHVSCNWWRVVLFSSHIAITTAWLACWCGVMVFVLHCCLCAQAVCAGLCV